MKSRQFSLRSLFFNNSTIHSNNINENSTGMMHKEVVRQLEQAAVTIPKPATAPAEFAYSPVRSPPLSILKKRITSSGEMVELTLGSCTSLNSSPTSSPPASAPNSPAIPKRKSAQFKDDVDVMYFRCEDTADNTSKGKREQEKLKEVSSRKSRQTSANHLVLCPLHNCHCNEEMLQFFTDVQGNVITSNELLPGKRLDIITADDGSMKWKIVVPLGNEFVRNRTNVKAMTGGRKLIITGFKNAQTDEGEDYLHQYNDKLSLPHAIDAFSVKATMDRDGNLKITAPITGCAPSSPTSSLTNAII